MLTGRGLEYGGSFVRVQATGYGLVYFMEEMLLCNGSSFDGKTVVVSGSGNVAIYAHEKATRMGGKVVAMSDSGGYIYDKNGVDLDAVKEIKEVKRGRISEYLNYHPEAEYHAGCKGIWTIPCDIALPCATQNELDLESAKTLVKNGVIAVGEGANMPSTNEAVRYLLENNILFGPAKAANAGGVACSALEMAQSGMRIFWNFEEVDSKLQHIMKGIFHNIADAAARYGKGRNYLDGANIAGFEKVAKAMMAQGVV